MTNKEAIEQLKWVQKRICDITYSPESFEAIDLATKALEESEQLAEWLKELKAYKEASKGDLISREALKKCAIPCQIHNGALTDLCVPLYQIDNAPTVEYTFEEAFQKTVCENRLYCPARPQGEYVDISKLRLMTVEECAGHTIDYAMGWKACIEWIKKGGADMKHKEVQE